LVYNEALVISDGYAARAGTLTSGWDRFQPWRTIEGGALAPKGAVQLEVLIKGLFDRRRFLDYVLNFVTFEDDGRTYRKRGGLSQYWAVEQGRWIAPWRPADRSGDRRIGVGMAHPGVG
jgi:type I restriction enzyme R subunit